jgi:hypothetical protein
LIDYEASADDYARNRRLHPEVLGILTAAGGRSKAVKTWHGVAGGTEYRAEPLGSQTSETIY